MASHTAETMNKRRRHLHNQGRDRKRRESQHSTPSAAELFAACGEPGQPAPAPTATRPAPR
jgi:hypothetical protein